MLTELPTISKAAQRMRSGELTPLDLVEHCLARIDEFDRDIHAWVLVDAEGARREAQRLSQLAEEGEWLGPLHGIPIGIKDIIDVADWNRPVSTNAPGEAGDPESPHYSDLLADWAAGRYHPLPYSRKAVEAATIERIHLTPRADSPGIARD